MVKRWIYCLVVFLFLIPLINAGSIGISPAKFQLYFEPNIEVDYTFTASSANPNEYIHIEVKGDLTEYVTVSQTRFLKGGSFVVTLKLPSNISVPGNHRILIAAVPFVDESELNGTLGGKAVVQAPIDVYVPYPGKYVEAEFMINDVSESNNAIYKLKLHSLGTDFVVINSRLELYDTTGKNKILTQTLVDSERMNSKEEREFIGLLNSSELKPGSYKLKVIVDYEQKVIELDELFRVGYLFVNITDYSYEFETGKINQFDIEVENLWNQELKNVYGEVTVTEKGKILEEIKTFSIDLKPWKRTNITGFFDAINITEGRYIANIKIFYQGESSYKLVAVYAYDPPLEMIWVHIAAIASTTLILGTIVFIYLIYKVKKYSNKYDKKNKK